jgi:hypothetical protein
MAPVECRGYLLSLRKGNLMKTLLTTDDENGL